MTESINISMRRINELKPYEKNPRKNDSAVDAVAASIKEFGWEKFSGGKAKLINGKGEDMEKEN